MNPVRTNIVIIPKTGLKENAAGITIAAIIFIPFILGFITGIKWLFLSLPLGFVLMGLYNLVTKGKFIAKNWVQKDLFIEFDVQGIKLISSIGEKSYRWSEMQDVHLLVEGYKGEINYKEDSSNYTGTENKLTFHVDGVEHQLHFYLSSRAQKEELKHYLKNKELVADMQLSIKNREEVFDSDIKSFQRIKEEPEDPGKKKKGMGCLIAFLFPFVLVGLGTLCLFLYGIAQVYRASYWEPVNAQVLYVEVISSSSGESNSSKLEIEYEYKVGNQSYKGNAGTFNVGMNNIEDYGGLYHILHEAEIIEVYVNKNNPNESVAIRGITNSIVFIGLFSLMWNALISVIIIPLLFKKVRAKNLFIATLIIWGLSIAKLVTHAGEIDLPKQVIVIELKQDVNQ